MIHFFSRRKFDSKTQTFDDTPGKSTRYGRFQTLAGGAEQAELIERAPWMSEVLASAVTPDILIYVHGFNTEHREMLDRHKLIAAGLSAQGYQGAVVSFDWPSDGLMSHYSEDREDAKAVAPFFAKEGFRAIMRAAPGHRVHILAHSMGALLVLRAFSGQGGDWRAGQVLFVAADAERSWMKKGAWGALVMENHCTRLTNYFGLTDEVLNLANVIVLGTEPRAGWSGLPASIPANHQDIDCARRYMAQVPNKTVLKSHRWYFADTGFYRDAALTLAGTAASAMPTRQPKPNGEQELTP